MIRLLQLLFCLIVAAQGSIIAAEPAPGARQGAKLYVGTVSFKNGAAPCLACHGVAGFGLAGAANYGPDLTALATNFGDDGVAGILEDLTAFPSMAPLFEGRPLTEGERENLLEFFREAAKREAPRVGWRFFLEVGLVTALFFGLCGVLARKKFRESR